MYYVFIATLIIVGILAASSFLENKVPQMKTVINHLKPHEGWIGLVALVLGFVWFLKRLIHLGTYLKWSPVYTLIYIASLGLLMVIGFLLAQNLIKQFSGKNKKANDITNKMVDKFSPLQERLGLAAIGTGVLNLLLIIT